MKQIQYITRLNTGEIDKFVLVDVTWSGWAVSDLPDRGARVELTSLLLLFQFYVWISCQTPSKYPYLGLLKYLIASLDRRRQESNIVKSNFMITQSCKLTSSGYFPFQTTNWLSLSDCKLEEESLNDKWLLTIILSYYTPWSPAAVWQCDSSVCVSHSIFSGPGVGGPIMGIRRQIINASISLHYQIGRLVARINVVLEIK